MELKIKDLQRIMPLFCTVELCKMIKERNITDIPCGAFYHLEGGEWLFASTSFGLFMPDNLLYMGEDGLLACPTHEMIIWWLRVTHGVNISLRFDPADGAGWTAKLHYADAGGNKDERVVRHDGGYFFGDREEAAEAAIKAALQYDVTRDGHDKG